MEQSTLLYLAELAQALAAVLTIGAYLPQVVRLYQEKHCGSISLSSWYIWLASGVMALFYALVMYLETGIGGVLLLSCALNVFFILLIIGMLVYYKDGEQPANFFNKQPMAKAPIDGAPALDNTRLSP